jgi:hypothetical protein
MEGNQIIILALVGVAAVVLIIFLVWKNRKDKKEFNPGSQDAVDEAQMDRERNRKRS